VKLRTSITILSLLALSGAGCDSWVEEVDPPTNIIVDDALTDESQVDFMITGLEGRFARSYADFALLAGGLSDEFLLESANPDALFPTFRQFDDGEFSFTDSEVERVYRFVNEFRFLADNLLERIQGLEFSDPEVERRANFAANFYGGVARYFLATYVGKTEREGGGIITTDPSAPGPFLPSEALYDSALSRLENADSFADVEQQRLINTLRARIYLLLEDFASAAPAAAAGMAPDDAPLEVLYSGSGVALNFFAVWAGPAPYYAWTFSPTYSGFVAADSNEAARLPIVPIMPPGDSVHVFYGQDRYRNTYDPLPFLTWQENSLMLAEVDLRNGNLAGAIVGVNTVRASHGIDPLDTIDMKVLEEERRKELWGMGLRLVDQRRFGTWHLGDDTWQYFPIPQSERNTNPNL
jgi:hypothetical protein